jgi:hypothetical protein
MEGSSGLSVSERADALEFKLMEELNAYATKSVLYVSGEVDPTNLKGNASAVLNQRPGATMLIGPDPRLKKMPERPTLQDFFRLRFASTNHVLQSARLARRNGCDEKIVFACLLHDIANAGFIRSDHGWWGAQLLEPINACAFLPTRRRATNIPTSMCGCSAPTTYPSPISARPMSAPASTNGT